MKYLHTMIRVQNLDSALDYFIDKLGMKEVRRKEVPEGKFTLVFLAADDNESQLELTYNWDQNEPYSGGDNFGHVAYSVENIYDYCEKLEKKRCNHFASSKGRKNGIHPQSGSNID